MQGIERLLRPKSIAVVGGGTWGANIVKQSRAIGFQGPIWPVHPAGKIIGGVQAYKRIEDLPAAPDAVFIGVNRDATIPAVRALRALGAGGVVCFAAGFSESQAETGDGADKQSELLEAAGEMTLVGPNCYGLLNYLDGAALWPDQQGGQPVQSGVALISQSSNVAMNLSMQDRGLPFAYIMAIGNQAQTGVSALGTALLQDSRVTALGLHIEGIDDLRAFEHLASEARRLRKPLVALRVGKSEQAQSAALSHTASLAGSAAGASALFERLGVGQVNSLPQLLETLKLVHVTGALPSNRIASISCSGGEASLMGDAAHGAALVLPPLDATQKQALREALGPKVALANPLDYHTYIWGDEAALIRTFQAMMTGDLALGCLILDLPRTDRCDPHEWNLVVEAVLKTRFSSGKAMAIVSTLKENLPEHLAQRLMNAGVVPFTGLEEAIKAMEVAAWIGASWAKKTASEPLLLPPQNHAGGAQLSEAEAKAALTAHGLVTPRSARATSPAEAAKVAEHIGFPLVLKGEGLAHKSEAGAVVLSLSSPEAVEAAAQAMPASSFLLETQIPKPVAELLVGLIADPAHGYVLTLGAGGVLTELMQDTRSLLVPASRAELRDALLSLRMGPLLTGYRGQPAADMEAILDAIDVVQAYASARGPMEVEVNPLMCLTQGAVAVDALIRS